MSFFPEEDIRPCLVCGAPVECEPDYPWNIQVVCEKCIRDQVKKVKKGEVHGK